MTVAGRMVPTFAAFVELADESWTALAASIGSRVICEVDDETIVGRVVHEGGRYLIELACAPDGDSTDRGITVRLPRAA